MINSRKKVVLITGGAGFIGVNLTRKLLSRGDTRVICLDSFLSGSRENILEFLKNDDYEAIRHDVTEKFAVECDEIYHLACPASPPTYQKNGIKTLKTSVIGTLNALGVSRRTGAKLLLASTSEIYGNPTVHPQREDYLGNVNCCGPRACYDEGKRAAEALVSDYRRQHNIDARVVRIFNTYGPGMSPKDGRIVSNLIMQALKGDPLTIYGDGTQTRSFCYVDDLVDGLISVMHHPNSDIGPVNLGNPNTEITMNQLAEHVQEIVGGKDSKLTIVHKEIPADDPVRRQPDISKAKTLLNWEPKIDLREGLLLSIEYFKKFIHTTTVNN